MLNRPEPLLHPAARPVDRSVSPGRAAEWLCAGETLLVKDHFGTGLEILVRLRALVPPPADDAPYEVRRAYRCAWGATSRRLLAPIADHRVALAEAPAVGFLPVLYPDLATFVLPFVEVQDLEQAWSWYERGVHLAVLGRRVHPFYGTYVPNRPVHLELFATWLSQFQGRRRRAVDVGTGCGVLAMLLSKAGFERVLATDSNPNAVESVRRDLRWLSPPPQIEPVHCDLLGDDPTPVDLVVFNPPWMAGVVEGMLDEARYFEEGLFERFFEQASARLAPDGRVVVVFSNLIQLVQPNTPHPILAELDRGRFEPVQKLNRRVKPAATDGHPRRRTRERVEVWELALKPGACGVG